MITNSFKCCLSRNSHGAVRFARTTTGLGNLRVMFMSSSSTSTTTTVTSSSCPITGTKQLSGDQQSTCASSSKSFDELPGPKRYPLFGTVFDLVSKHKGNRSNAALHHYNEFGSIVRIELTGPEVMFFDPRDYLQVFRGDGPYPRGGAGDVWPFQKYLARSSRVTGMLSNGSDWKHARTGMQADILSPQAAQSYLPLINPAVATASANFGNYLGDIHAFATRASFDMFTAAMVGKSTATLDPNANEEDLIFIDKVVKLFHVLAELLLSPYETRLKPYMDTDKYKEFAALMDFLLKKSDVMVNDAIGDAEQWMQAQQEAQRAEDTAVDASSVERLYSGEGVSDIKSSECYVRRAYERGFLSKEQLTDELALLFFAGVDTTSNYISWLIYHMAKYPDKQQKLHEELAVVLQGADYSSEHAKQLPYLRACYRESHRIQPLLPTLTSRFHEKDASIGGYMIPAGTRMSFNLMAVQHDQRYVEQPMIYLPERWLEAAVAKRKGTEAELLDHRLLATPFSFGPRMCLGSRLAETEILSLLARLLQDWEISLASDCPVVEPVQKLFVSPEPSPKLCIRPRTGV